MGPGGNDLAVLFDGGLLEAVEVVEQGLPCRRQPLGLTRAGQFLGQRQGQELAKHMTADRCIGLMEDWPGIEAGLGHAE